MQYSQLIKTSEELKERQMDIEIFGETDDIQKKLIDLAREKAAEKPVIIMTKFPEKL